MNKVAVVILNFKVKDLIIKCIESVKKSDFKDFLLIVVDNNSQDNLGNELDKDVIFIQNNKNLGYTGGNNLGIKRALNLGAEYIFILNPDTEIKKDTISVLIKKAKEYDAAIVCPKIYFYNSRKIWYAGKDFDMLNVLGKHRGLDMEDTGQFDRNCETAMNGAAVLIRGDVFRKIGFFDEKFFLYLEDSDFSLRAKIAGFKIMYIYQAIVYHKNAQSTGLGSPLQDYFITRNRMLFAKKHLTLRTKFALFREALKNFNKPAKRTALFDFLLGNLGKGSFIK